MFDPDNRRHVARARVVVLLMALAIASASDAIHVERDEQSGHTQEESGVDRKVIEERSLEYGNGDQPLDFFPLEE